MSRLIKRIKKRQLRKRNVNELFERRKLLLNVKKYKKRRRNTKYNVNWFKKPSVPSSVGDSDTYSGSTGTGVGNDWVRVQVRDQEFLS